MMRTIRTGLFETASSSIHSLCIDMEGQQVYPSTLIFRGAEFGWDYEKYESIHERAAYLWTAISQLDLAEEWKERLEDHLSTLGITCVFEDYWDAHIDHGYELQEFLQELAIPPYKMLDAFLFGENSCIFTGNDNFGMHEGYKAWQNENVKGEVIWKGN